jgi:ankyrin repeat protein
MNVAKTLRSRSVLFQISS